MAIAMGARYPDGRPMRACMGHKWEAIQRFYGRDAA